MNRYLRLSASINGFKVEGFAPFGNGFSKIDMPSNLRYGLDVDQIHTESPDFPAERLALAQQAFREFHARCFWFMRRDAQILPDEIPYLCDRLRADGGRRGFQIAAELCR